MKKLFKKLNPSTLFGRIFAMAAGIIALIILAGFIFNMYGTNRTMEQQIIRSGIETTEQTSGMISQNLEMLSHMLNSTLYSKDIIQPMLSRKLPQFEKMSTVTQALSDAVNASDMIDAIYLYSPRNLIGLSSDYTVSNYQNDSYLGVLSRFFTRKGKLSAKDYDNGAVYSYTEGKNTYLIGGFPNIRYDCSCYILLKINQRAFYRSINFITDGDVRVYNGSGDSIFDNAITNDASANENSKLFKVISDKEDEFGSFLYSGASKGSYRVFYRRDRYTGWTTAYLTEASSFKAFSNSGNTFVAILFLLILIAVSMPLIFTGAKRISKPLDTLMHDVGSESERAPSSASGDEWDYLRTTYSSLVSRKKELEKYLPLAADSLQDDLLREILKGNAFDSEEIETRLSLVNSSFSSDGECAVLLADASDTESMSSNEMADVLSTIELRERIREIMNSSDLPFSIISSSSQGRVIVICGAGKNNFNTDFDGIVQNLKSIQLSIGAATWGVGNIVKGLSRLPESHTVAENDLEFSRYHQNIPSGITVSDTVYRSYIAQIHNISLRIQSRNTDGLSQSVHGLFDSLSTSELDGSSLKQIYRLLYNVIVESSDKVEAGIPELSAEEMRARCLEYVDSLLSKADSEQNHYINLATQYITGHYADTSLSLEQIADFVGISASYLSRLFTSSVGKSITTYLNDYRIQNAKKLLAVTDLPTQEVGYMTGFCSAATFFRVFKKSTGITPKQYRTSIHNTEDSI